MEFRCINVSMESEEFIFGLSYGLILHRMGFDLYFLDTLNEDFA